MFDNIKEPKEIPFYNHDRNILETIKKSSNRRSQSMLHFSVRKIKNIMLNRLAFFCPFVGLRVKFHRWRGVNIGKDVYIGPLVNIDNAYPEYVYLDNYCSVNQGATIIAHTNVRKRLGGVVKCKVTPVHLKEYSLVSINAIILPGVEIGEYSIVSAGSVVLNNIKPYSLAIGNPARVLNNHKEKVIKQMSEK